MESYSTKHGEKDILKSKDLIIRNLEGITANQQIKTDDALLHKSDASSLSAHNEQYTALLKSYVKDFEENSKNKRKNKEDLFKIAKGLLIAIPSFTAIFIIVILISLILNKINVLEALLGMFTALASLLGTFMAVPRMITKYLFNKKEEEHLTDVISRIQEYDRDIRSIKKDN